MSPKIWIQEDQIQSILKKCHSVSKSKKVSFGSDTRIYFKPNSTTEPHSNLNLLDKIVEDAQYRIPIFKTELEKHDSPQLAALLERIAHFIENYNPNESKQPIQEIIDNFTNLLTEANNYFNNLKIKDEPCREMQKLDAAMAELEFITNSLPEDITPQNPAFEEPCTQTKYYMLGGSWKRELDSMLTECKEYISNSSKVLGEIM